MLELRGLNRFVCVGIDGWTNINGKHLYNVLLLSEHRAYYYKTIVTDEPKETAIVLAKHIVPIIEELIAVHQLKIIGFVADNEATNLAIRNIIAERYPFISWQGCAAHAVQLLCGEICREPSIVKSLNQVTKLVQFFRHSKANYVRFKQLQPLTPDSPKPLSLLYWCDTRWTSRVACCTRLLRVRKTIDLFSEICYPALGIHPEDSHTFWFNVDIVNRVLQPFLDACNAFQSDSSNLYTLHRHMLKLKTDIDGIFMKLVSEYCPELSIPQHQRYHNMIGRIRVQVNKAMNSNFEQYFSHPAIHAVRSVLNIEATNERDAMDLLRGRTWLLDWGTKLLKQYYNGDATTLEALKAQLHHYNQQEGMFGQMSVEVARLVAKDGKSFEIVKHKLLEMEIFASQITHALIALFSLSVSEAAVERSFSIQKIVHSLLRNCLSDDEVENEMRVKFNLKQLKVSIKTSTQLNPELYLDAEATVLNEVLKELDNLTNMNETNEIETHNASIQTKPITP